MYQAQKTQWWMIHHPGYKEVEVGESWGVWQDTEDLIPIEISEKHWLPPDRTTCFLYSQSVWALLMYSCQPLFLHHPLPNSCPFFTTHPQVTPLLITGFKTSLCSLWFSSTYCLSCSFSSSILLWTVKFSSYFYSSSPVCKLLMYKTTFSTLRILRAFNMLSSVQ